MSGRSITGWKGACERTCSFACWLILSRQTSLASLFLQCRQGGGGITPEALARGPRRAPPIETLPEIFPLFPINTTQISAAWRPLPRGNGGDQPRLPTQHRRGGGPLVAGGAGAIGAPAA